MGIARCRCPTARWGGNSMGGHPGSFHHAYHRDCHPSYRRACHPSCRRNPARTHLCLTLAGSRAPACTGNYCHNRPNRQDMGIARCRCPTARWGGNSMGGHPGSFHHAYHRDCHPSYRRACHPSCRRNPARTHLCLTLAGSRALACTGNLDRSRPNRQDKGIVRCRCPTAHWRGSSMGGPPLSRLPCPLAQRVPWHSRLRQALSARRSLPPLRQHAPRRPPRFPLLPSRPPRSLAPPSLHRFGQSPRAQKKSKKHLCPAPRGPSPDCGAWHRPGAQRGQR